LVGRKELGKEKKQGVDELLERYPILKGFVPSRDYFHTI